MGPERYEQGGVDRHRVLVGAAVLEVTTSWSTDGSGRHAVSVAARLVHNGLGEHEAVIELCDASAAVLLARPLALQRRGFEQPWWAECRGALPFESGVASVRFWLQDRVSGAASPVRVTTPAGPSALRALTGMTAPISLGELQYVA